jgi:hypothetical protein
VRETRTVEAEFDRILLVAFDLGVFDVLDRSVRSIRSDRSDRSGRSAVKIPCTSASGSVAVSRIRARRAETIPKKSCGTSRAFTRRHERCPWF